MNPSASLRPPAPPPARKRETPRTARGFTLVEILVVVFIILLLIGISLAAMRNLHQGTDVKKTKLAMKVLLGAAGEYWTLTGQRINSSTTVTTPWNWTSPPNVYQFKEEDWMILGLRNRNDPPAQPVPAAQPYTDIPTQSRSDSRFIYAAWQVPSVRTMLQPLYQQTKTLVPDEIWPNHIYPILRDAWGNRMKYYTKNLATDPNYNDPTVPWFDGVFFASAGPDGAFGKINGNAAEQLEAQDNIYSFKLE